MERRTARCCASCRSDARATRGGRRARRDALRVTARRVKGRPDDGQENGGGWPSARGNVGHVNRLRYHCRLTVGGARIGMARGIASRLGHPFTRPWVVSSGPVLTPLRPVPGRPPQVVAQPELGRLIAALVLFEARLRHLEDGVVATKAGGSPARTRTWQEAGRLRQALQYSNGYLLDVRVLAQARNLLGDQIPGEQRPAAPEILPGPHVPSGPHPLAPLAGLPAKPRARGRRPQRSQATRSWSPATRSSVGNVGTP